MNSFPISTTTGPSASRNPPPLRLDRNEGPPLDAVAASILSASSLELARRYPSAADLETKLAERVGVEPGAVLVTAGGDEAIDRVCRATLSPGDRFSLHTPTFEMVERFTAQTGADIDATSWRTGAFPIELFLGTIREDTQLAAVVSPNNPTGAVIASDAICAIADRASDVGAVTLVDLAYSEFTGADPTHQLIDRPGVVIVRTFSKMYALAGLRVGWLVGDRAVVDRARDAAGPFPTSGLSLAAATRALDLPESWIRERAGRVRRERDLIAGVFRSRGIGTTDSEANFVCAIMPSADSAAAFAASLARHGVLVRTWPNRPRADDLVRITCPGDGADLARLLDALAAALDQSHDGSDTDKGRSS